MINILKLTNIPTSMFGTLGTTIKIDTPKEASKPWVGATLHTAGIKDSHKYKFANITLDKNCRFIDLTDHRSFRFMVSVVEIWQETKSLILVIAKTDHPKTLPNRYTAKIEDLLIGIPLDKVEDFDLPEPGEPYMLIFEYFENEI